METKKQYIYHAHSKRKSKESKQKEFAWMRVNFPECKIVDPNALQGANWAVGDIYLEMIKRSDFIVASEYKGFVGAGVYKNIEVALKYNKDIIVIREVNGEIEPFALKSIKINNKDDWATFYGKIEVEV